MAVHTITLSDAEESIYQKYLVLINKTDAECMAGVKTALASQVVQRINEAGREKFNALPIADKLTFIG